MNDNENTPETDTTPDTDYTFVVVAAATCVGGYYAGKKVVRKLRARSRGLAGVYLITTMR